MMRSMFSGVSGLRVHQTKMDVIANNISNVNTVGFKSSRVTFRDAFYQRIQGAAGANATTGRTGTNPMQIGLGVNVASIDSIMTQGLSQRTDNSYDAMIEGEGFFIVGDSSGTYFTRAGNISRDANWNLNINGLALKGWDTTIDADTKEVMIQKGPVVDLSLGGEKQYVPPSATTMIDMVGNLNVNDLPTIEGADGYDYKEVTSTLDFFDSVGNNYKADVTFKYYEYNPTDGNNNTQNHVRGVWTFEFETFNDENGASGVLVYPEGDKDNPKKVALHVGGENSYNTVSTTPGTAGPWDQNFSPNGMLIFDTEGKMVGWDTLNLRTPTMAGTPLTATAPRPTRADVIAQVNALGLIYDTTTGDVVGAADYLAAHGSFPTDLTMTAPTAPPTGFSYAAGWRTLEGVGDSQMELIIAPIDVLDPTATFGELTPDITIEHQGEGATANIPPAAAGGTPTNSPTNLVVQAGIMTLNWSEFTQWGGEGSGSEVNPERVDGNEPGTLMDISIAGDGKITGRYSNGETKLLGQIAVAKFDNPAGLDRVGNNLFTETANSGPFTGGGTEGSIMSGALEMSNVDLSQEFTEMITTQRGFQANSRIITVSDEMLQELVNLKR